MEIFLKSLIEYIDRLSSMIEEDRFKEITREEIALVLNGIEFEEKQEICNTLQDKLLLLEDPELAFELAANVYWIDLEKCADVVVASGDVECNYYYARDIEGANVKRHGEVIINSGDAEYNYLFAKDVDEADIKSHGKVVMDSGSVWYNYMFVLDVNGSDIKGHGKVIIDKKDVYYNYVFASEITGSDVQAHCGVILESLEKDKYISRVKEEKQYHMFSSLGIPSFSKVKKNGDKR